MIVTDASFEEVIKDNSLVLIDFWADWCGPCKKVAPILDEISESHGLPVGKLNIDENPEKTQEYSVHSIPTMVLFKDGIPEFFLDSHQYLTYRLVGHGIQISRLKLETPSCMVRTTQPKNRSGLNYYF